MKNLFKSSKWDEYQFYTILSVISLFISIFLINSSIKATNKKIAITKRLTQEIIKQDTLKKQYHLIKVFNTTPLKREGCYNTLTQRYPKKIIGYLSKLNSDELSLKGDYFDILTILEFLHKNYELEINKIKILFPSSNEDFISYIQLKWGNEKNDSLNHFNQLHYRYAAYFIYQCTKYAILTDNQSHDYRLKIGEKIEDALVDDINEDSVRLMIQSRPFLLARYIELGNKP